jgi:glycosyltransferase involved in cell wall biosynthesis
LIRHNKSGFLVETKNPAEYSEKMIQLIEDRDLCQTFGDSGYAIANDGFTLDRMVKEYETVYDSILRAPF